MKTLKFIFAVTIFLLCSLYANAYDFAINGMYYNILSGTDSVEVTSSNDYTNRYTGDIIIPSTVSYEGKVYQVVAIGYAAFQSAGLNSISIPNSVKYIGGNAFNLSEIVSVKLPNSVTYIGDYAFTGKMFTTFIVDDNNPNYATENGILYDKNKTSLLIYPMGKNDSSFVVPNSVESIGRYAFEECISLISVTLPKSLISIGYASFEGSGLTTVTIPASVKTISSWAFTKCPNLKKIIFEGEIKTIGSYVFADWGYVPRAYDLEVKCNPFPISSSFSSDFDLEKSTLTVPEGTKTLFESTPVWQDFKVIIENTSTAIPAIQPEITIFVSSNTLYLNSPVSETISIYSITGNLLYSTIKSAGEKQITLENIHNNMGIIKGSSGWVRKIR